jgi:RecA-family ATPase
MMPGGDPDQDYFDQVNEAFEEAIREEARSHANTGPKQNGKSGGAHTTANKPSPGSAEALKTMTFPAIKYVVPGIFVEGLTLFAGKPKIGKSWLLLHASVAVARGGFTLGEIKCIEGDVLYCALEDNQRRLQSRLTKLLGLAVDWPARWNYWCEMPRLSNGGLDCIRDWIKSKPQPRLVVIDTLAMVREPPNRNQSTYDADYAAVLELRKLANETGVAIVLVHHLRKAGSDDAFDTVSGTLGLTGAPDSVLVLKRDTAGTIVLHGRGRDLTEIEMAMTFDKQGCTWRITGEADQVRRSTERTAILQAMEEAGEPVGPNDIAAAIGMKAVNVRFLLGKLVKEGVVEKARYGKYRIKSGNTKSGDSFADAMRGMSDAEYRGGVKWR